MTEDAMIPDETHTSAKISSKRKRPKGLASVKTSKKQRTEEEVLVPQPEVGEDQKTILLPGDLAEDDEVGQLKALYLTAVDHINAKNLAEAVPILNGTVHEADRILRNCPLETKLPYEFHWVYASALLDLSFTVDDETAKEGEKMGDYISFALDRCDAGFDAVEPGLDQLKLVKARCQTRRVQWQLAHEEGEMETMLASMQNSMALIDESFAASQYLTLQLSRTLDLIQEFADSLLEEKPDLHKSMNDWVEAKWTSVLTEDQENISALEGCGRVWLSQAQPLLNNLEDEDCADPAKAVAAARETLETSVELLLQSLKCAERQKAVSGDLLCLLAEATISLANTYDDGPQYDDYENSTIQYLRRAEEMPDFDMPERFRDLLHDEKDETEVSVHEIFDGRQHDVSRKLSVVAEVNDEEFDDDDT